MPCIWYLAQFQNNEVQALINSNSEVNVMTRAYAMKLGLTTWKTSVGAQKIDGLLLETYGIVLASFLLLDNLGRVRFFEKTFLLAESSIEVVLGIPFLSLNNVNVKFAELGKLTWRLYTVAEALKTISQVELIDKKEFAKVAMDENSETFGVHMSALDVAESSIYLSRAAQIAAL